MVALRDGRKLIGVLRSWDQFGIFLLHSQLPHAPHLTNASKPCTPINYRENIRSTVQHQQNRTLCRCETGYLLSERRERLAVRGDRFR